MFVNERGGENSVGRKTRERTKRKTLLMTSLFMDMAAIFLGPNRQSYQLGSMGACRLASPIYVVQGHIRA